MDLTFSTSDTETFKSGEDAVAGWKSQYPKDFLLECLDHPVVAFDGNHPVGLFECTIDYFEDVMWLDALWIHPDHRLKGYGTAILSYLVETCQYSRIKLFAANHSDPFYEAHGFSNTLGKYYEKEIND